jgi:hypothetical protein
VTSPRSAGGQPVLHFSVTGGCSCEFLGDDAEFEAEVRALAPSHLSTLGTAVSVLASECKSFSFVVRWLSGEGARKTERLSAGALLGLIRDSRVANNVLYVVGQGPH